MMIFLGFILGFVFALIWAALAPIIWLAKAFTHLRSMTRKKICGLSTVAFCASLARSEIDSSTKTAKASNTSAKTNPANAGFYCLRFGIITPRKIGGANHERKQSA